MALATIRYRCKSCGVAVTASPSRTFLGFQKTTCPSCHAKEKFPLSKGYRVTYTVVCILMVLTILMAAQQGEIGFPGGIGVLVIAALFIDWRLKRKTKPLLI